MLLRGSCAAPAIPETKGARYLYALWRILTGMQLVVGVSGRAFPGKSRVTSLAFAPIPENLRFGLWLNAGSRCPMQRVFGSR